MAFLSSPPAHGARRVPARNLCLQALLVLALAVSGTWLAAARAAGPAVSGGAAVQPVWDWPLNPAPPVIRAFQKPPQRWLAGHRGVDLAAAPGTPVLSPAAGTVRFTGRVVDRGVLTIDHGGGLLSSFEPVAGSVTAGERVEQGQPVGQLEARPSGGPENTQPHCPGSCLHWGVRLDGDYVDPLRYLMDRRPSVLLPLGAGPPADAG